MTDFIYDNTDLPDGKSDHEPITVPANEALTAPEWNTLCQAVKDARSALLAITTALGAIPSSVVAGLDSNISALNASISALDAVSHSPVTLAAVGSAPNANGASLSGQQLKLQPADATNPGAITAGDQTFGGTKTFTGVVSSFADVGGANQNVRKASFDCSANPAQSSPGLANFNKPLEIGGNYYSALDDDNASVYIGALCNRTGGPITSILNNYGQGGQEVHVFDAMYDGDGKFGKNVILGVLGTDGRVISQTSSLYLIANNGPIYSWSKSAGGSTTEWYKGSGGALVATLDANGKFCAAGGIGVGNAVSASTPGTVVKKMEVFDAAGNSLGFVPIYDAIT